MRTCLLQANDRDGVKRLQTLRLLNLSRMKIILFLYKIVKGDKMVIIVQMVIAMLAGGKEGTFSLFETIVIVTNSFLAIGAIGALYYTAKTYRLSEKNRKDDRMSRRAFIAPCTDAGGIISRGGGKVLCVYLQNCGENPVSNFRSRFFPLIGEPSDKDIENINNPSDFNFVFNPVPKGQIIKIEVFPDAEAYKLIRKGILALRLSYNDEKLNKKYNCTFYWTLDKDRELLMELNQKELEFAKKMGRTD